MFLNINEYNMSSIDAVVSNPKQYNSFHVTDN